MNPTLTSTHQMPGAVAPGFGSFSFSIKNLNSQHFGIKLTLECSSHYKLLFLTKGSAEYTLDKRKIRIDPSSIGIVKPNQQLSNLFYQQAEGFIISFTPEYLQLAVVSSPLIQQLQLGISGIDKVPVPENDYSFIKDLSMRLLEEFNSSNGLQEEVIRGLFQVFALYLTRASAKLKPVIEGKCNRYTQRFFALLDQHFMTLKMPADYADLMAVTPAYLNIIIKESLGYTTSHFIQQRILTEAKRLMMFEELNMKEVAYRLGFFDVSHFSKFFKRISGERFTDFKRSFAA